MENHFPLPNLGIFHCEINTYSKKVTRKSGILTNNVFKWLHSGILKILTSRLIREVIRLEFLTLIHL